MTMNSVLQRVGLLSPTFRADRRGAVAIQFALVITAIVSAAAAGLDYSYAAWRQQDLQRAADAAALAAARLNVIDINVVKQDAERLFSANVQAKGVTPVVSVGDETVTVEASYAQPTFMARVMGHEKIDVAARAVARRSFAKPCIIVLEPTQKNGIVVNGGAKLDADCKVQVNSKHPQEALYINSGSILLAPILCVSGGWTNQGVAIAAPKKCDPVADPLVNLPVPPEASGACKYSNHTVNGGNVSLTPGVYCNNFTLNSGAVATLSPGTCVFRDGVLKLNSASKLKGAGVLLFFTGSGSRLEVDSDSSLEVSPSTGGAYAGIVMFQDRNTSTDFFVLNAHAQSKLEGTIYLPNSPLRMNSNSTMTASPYLALVVRRLDLNSGSNLVIRNIGPGSTQNGVALIQ
jgi:Flp pilus assembly protein TadG